MLFGLRDIGITYLTPTPNIIALALSALAEKSQHQGLMHPARERVEKKSAGHLDKLVVYSSPQSAMPWRNRPFERAFPTCQAPRQRRVPSIWVRHLAQSLDGLHNSFPEGWGEKRERRAQQQGSAGEGKGASHSDKPFSSRAAAAPRGAAKSRCQAPLGAALRRFSQPFWAPTYDPDFMYYPQKRLAGHASPLHLHSGVP